MAKQRFLEIKYDDLEGSIFIDMEKIVKVAYVEATDEISILTIGGRHSNPLPHGTELLAKILEYGETEIGRND